MSWLNSITPKILKDTLKSPTNNKYSRKSITMFVSFLMCLEIAIAYQFDVNTPEFVFWGFIGMTGSITGVSVADKYLGSKNKKENKKD